MLKNTIVSIIFFSHFQLVVCRGIFLMKEMCLGSKKVEKHWSNEWRGLSPRLSAWVNQLRKNVAAMVSRWLHCGRFDRPGFQPQTSLTNSDVTFTGQ